ncbi:Gfo/Idh/MocA family oxidoreductase [candidate division KSB1 bacterium]|nr:Gfo/Idh/MocA family oxidoreductase [candidate division KSB1 bacterium]
MKKRLNIGLIGVGRLGSMYAEYLAYRVPSATLVATADLIPDRAQEAAERYDLPRWYDNHSDLLHDPEIDAVVITATTRNHKEIVIDAARCKKPTFCEKPLTLDLSDAREMKQVIESTGVFYQQGFQRRFDKGFRAAKERLEQGVIGKAVVFRGSSRDPYLPTLEYLAPKNSGGQFIDMAIHDIDIARWYLGEIESTYAIGGVLAFPEVATMDDTDNAIMLLNFASGALGEIDVSRNGIYGYDIRAEVLGTKGTLKVGYLRETPILELTADGIKHDCVPYFPERFGEAYVSQLNDYLFNLIHDHHPMLTIDDGIAALQVAAAATLSQRQGKLIEIQSL